MDESGLLPALNEDEYEWLRPQLPADADSRQAIAAALRWSGDIAQTMDGVWPAAFDGQLCRPPDAHLLDMLVREWIIDGADSGDVIREASSRPTALTIRPVRRLPECHACSRESQTVSARYDSAQRDRRGWANLCPEHYELHGIGRLGTGLGQYLISWDEVSDEVRDAFLRARGYWEDRGAPVRPWLPWDDS